MGLASLARFVQRPRMSETQWAKAKPVRNPLVEAATDAQGNVQLEAPIGTQGRALRLLARLSRSEPVRRFELEPVGAFVWERCDGQHTVEGIARGLRETFRMNRIEADASLRAYLRTLGDRGLVSLTVPKR